MTTFRPELCRKVLDGTKTETRRPVSENPRSPWYVGECGLVMGREYAVQPGRGQLAVGRMRLTHPPHQEKLNEITRFGAIREGFPSRVAFFSYYEDLHGSIDYEQIVWVIRFALVSETPRVAL